jgi:Methylamine utilisation protein MauE
MVFASASFLCRVVIGGTFAVSAFSKFRALDEFVQAVRGFRVVPERFARGLAVVVAVLEVVVAGAMIGPAASVGAGLAVASLLLVAFSAGIVRVLRSATTTSCRCFGRSSAPVSVLHLWRNGFLLVVALIGFSGALAGVQPRPHDGAVATLLVGVGVIVVGIVIALEDVRYLFAAPSSRV